MSKDLWALVLMIAFVIVALSLSIYLWWGAPCELLKAWNYTMPGRCIQL